jgi:hypothetical protein
MIPKVGNMPLLFADLQILKFNKKENFADTRSISDNYYSFSVI